MVERSWDEDERETPPMRLREAQDRTITNSIEMTKKAIAAALATKPFRAFRVRSTEGPPLSVPAPDFAFLSPNGRLLGVFTDGGNGVKYLEVASIVSIEESGA